MPPSNLIVGCAGWNVPRDDAPRFPAEGSHLERYAAVFDGVEINSSFYRPHQPKTYARWAACTPPHFRFAVKLPRTITHEARLKDVEPLVAQFAAEAGALGEKLGVVLVQLPPSLMLDAGAAGALFDLLRASFGCALACEARHATWFTEAATQLLTDAGITRVLADPVVGYEGPFVPTAPLAYVRLHGSPRIYYSRYTPQQIADAYAWLAQQQTAWCILDNTAAGASVPNALELLELRERGVAQSRDDQSP